MNDSIMNSASHLKYIGVIIDSKLNWIPHITYVKNKISKGIGIMFKARDYWNKKCLSPTSLVLKQKKKNSVNHILEAFSS